MPLLLYGSTRSPTPGTLPKPKLYGVGMREIETSLFDQYKIKDRWHPRGQVHVARAYLLYPNTSALAWWDGFRQMQQIVFMPGHLSIRDMIAVARAEFPDVIPGPLTFRVKNRIIEREL